MHIVNNINIIFIKTKHKHNYLLDNTLSDSEKVFLLTLDYYYKMNKIFNKKRNGKTLRIIKKLKKKKYLIMTKCININTGLLIDKYIVFENRKDFNKQFFNNKEDINFIKNSKYIRNIFNGMIHRCYKAKENTIEGKVYRFNNDAYNKNGIRICKYWLNNRFNFIEFALKNNYIEGMSIDRIDNRGDYAPYNCQIISRKDNSIKVHMDLKKTKIQRFIDKVIYYRRKKNWLKQMTKLGYKKEDLI